MGYAEKLQRLCALKGIDQAALAERLGLSKSSISRILGGVQEPKVRLAYELARALGVTLDYLMDDAAHEPPGTHWAPVSIDEAAILAIVRRLGYEAAMDRLLAVPSEAHRRNGLLGDSSGPSRE